MIFYQYSNSNSAEAVGTLENAINIYTDMGRFSIAAKNHVNIAEICENELTNIEQVIKYQRSTLDYLAVLRSTYL